MFEGAVGAQPASAAVVSADELDSMVSDLGRVTGSGSDAQRIDQIRALEEIKAAAAAAQAQVTAAFVASQHTAQAAVGLKPDEVGKGVAVQVGLAKRESPARARRYVGWAKILTAELPHTFTALQRGQITEWRAMLVARETGWLSAEHRAAVDADLAGRLAQWGDKRTEAETKKAAARLDPHGAADRARKAAGDRRVSLRPAPDTMTYLSALLPVTQGVAAYTALTRHADSLRAAGDERGRGQIMADTLVERLTGQATADAVEARINLVMTDQTLFNTTHPRHGDSGDHFRHGHTDSAAGGGAAGPDEPAHLDGYGPIPAPLARRLVADAPAETRMWIRRLFTRPDTGQLVAMESTSRFFEHGLRQFLVIRDQICRTPWCEAPIRHLDHPEPVADGGETSKVNGQGLCEACNLARTAPGWHARPGPDTGAGIAGGHTVTTTTPTGHTYTSRAPDPPGTGPPEHRISALLAPHDGPSRIEAIFREHVLAA